MSTLGILLAIIGLVILEAFFSGTETAVTSADKGVLHDLSRRGDKRAGLARRLALRMERLLGTTLVGTDFSVVCSTTLALTLVADVAPPGWESLLNTLIMVPIVLVFGEFLPKSLARAHATELTLHLARPLRVAQMVMYPAVIVISRIAGLLSDLTGKGAADTRSKAFAARDDLRLVAQMATEQGVLGKDTGSLLEAVLDFESRPLREWLTPVAQAPMLAIDATVAELEALALRTSQTHVPVFEGDRHNIVGAVDLRDVLYATFGDLRRLREDRGQDTIRPHVQRNVLYVTEDKSVGALLQELRYHQTPILVLRDAAGATVGLVAVSTLLNALFRPEPRTASRGSAGATVLSSEAPAKLPHAQA